MERSHLPGLLDFCGNSFALEKSVQGAETSDKRHFPWRSVCYEGLHRMDAMVLMKERKVKA